MAQKPINPLLPEPGQDRVYVQTNSVLGNLFGGGMLGGLGGAVGGLFAGPQQMARDMANFQRDALQMEQMARAMVNQSQMLAPADQGPPIVGAPLEEALRWSGARSHIFTVSDGQVVAVRPAGPGETPAAAARWDLQPVYQAPETPKEREARVKEEIMAELDILAPEGVIEPIPPELRLSWWERVVIWLARLVHYFPTA